MAPKGKDAAPPPSAAPTDTTGLTLWSDEALAAENFACDPPSRTRPAPSFEENLIAGMVSWKRPSEFLGEEAAPCVVQAPPAPEEGEEPTPMGRELPKRVGEIGRGAIRVDPVGAVAHLVLPARRAAV